MIIQGDARTLDPAQFDRYGVIIADPPWPYDNAKSYRPRLGGYTYQPMTIMEIAGMPVEQLALRDCTLFLWSTNPKLPQALAVMAAWEFNYITKVPWIKVCQSDLARPRYGIGHWAAACSEDVLIGRRGKVSPPPPPIHLGLISPSFGHSRKPDSVHELAERLPGPYLEMFGRRDRDGWDVFGNDVRGPLDGLPLFEGGAHDAGKDT